MANRINELEKLIPMYQASYYAGRPTISDAEFDKLWDELYTLDPENEIFDKVGSDLGESNGFPKVKHDIVMGSQSKANTAEEMAEYFSKVDSSDFIAQFKMDGSSIALKYVNGKLISGVSRGDGEIGVDYTSNVKKMNYVPTSLKSDFTGTIRGEVLLTKENKDLYFADKANCRNAATGCFHRIDGEGCEYLDVVCYDAQYLDGTSFGTQENLQNFLSDNGFKVAPFKKFSKPTGSDAIKYINSIFDSLKNVEYDIDGIVWKENDINMSDLKNYRPETQIALKPARTLAVTTILDIEWSVKNGTMTPVAIIKPVEMLGATVKRANLANIRCMEYIGLEIGHEITITRCGEIIPKILKDNTTGKYARGYEF